MKAIIYFSLSKKQACRKIANEIDGDHFEIINLHKKIKFAAFQMVYYGYLSFSKKEIKFESPEINFEGYDEIVLVSPIWGGKVNVFMSQYLKKHQFKNKEVTIISSSMGDNKNYFSSFDDLIDKSNNVVQHIIYIKGSIVYERKV